MSFIEFNQICDEKNFYNYLDNFKKKDFLSNIKSYINENVKIFQKNSSIKPSFCEAIAIDLSNQVNDEWLKENYASEGAMAFVFNINIKNNNYVLRLTNNNSDLNGEFLGLYNQGMIAKSCVHVNKILDLGLYSRKDVYYKNNDKTLKNYGVYAIMEKADISFKNFLDIIRNENDESTKKKRKLTAIIQLLKGCDCIHKNGYVHLDLKPDNIQFNKDSSDTYQLQIIDFGLCVKIGDKIKIQGTPYYMSPYYNHYETNSQYLDYHAIGIIIMEIWVLHSIDFYDQVVVYNGDAVHNMEECLNGECANTITCFKKMCIEYTNPNRKPKTNDLDIIQPDDFKYLNINFFGNKPKAGTTLDGIIKDFENKLLNISNNNDNNNSPLQTEQQNNGSGGRHKRTPHRKSKKKSTKNRTQSHRRRR
jgi:serine/threonine protein kinase